MKCTMLQCSLKYNELNDKDKHRILAEMDSISTRNKRRVRQQELVKIPAAVDFKKRHVKSSGLYSNLGYIFDSKILSFTANQ